MESTLSNQKLLERAYAAFNAREIETVLALLDPQVDWPNGMKGGRVLGRDNVREYWRSQWEILDPRVEPLRMEDTPDGRTAVTVHQVVRDLAGNIVVEQTIWHVYSIRNGLIERMDIAESGSIPPHPNQQIENLA
jgi:hypothetical protein